MKPADKNKIRNLPEVCSPFRENAHNRFMASTAPQIPQSPQRTIYPTPPLFSSHAHENNNVTPKKAQTTCENKQLTPRSLSEFSHFAIEMEQSLSAVSNHYLKPAH
jgi:hypothetical protein